MLPLKSFYQSSSVSLRFLSTQSYYTSIIQRYSSSIRSHRPLFSPSAKKDHHNVTQTFDSLVDSRREQTRRTVLIHECALLQFSNEQSVNKLLNITSDRIRHFWQKTELTELDTRLRFFVASLVEEASGSIFVDTVCPPFGSSITKFGKSRCDLDMLLTFEDFREKNVRNLRMVFLNYERSDLQEIESNGKIQQLRFLTKRIYLNDRYPTA
ncbi:unnamed protein product [Adineta ricciae]|uniref:Poly(A) RNA polymerase mitochondrial-like central palm domain-containing protein n=1 Tax=Adineta ricciae TaxID=249248 RepID=A0A814ECR1_ADIRI|nr:unnamed protein product [Adineta ricciae]